MNPRVEEALERELTATLHAPIAPSTSPTDGLAEAVAIGATSALVISACSYALPFAGTAAGAALASGIAYKLAERQVRPVVQKHVLDAVDEVLAARTLVPKPGEDVAATSAWCSWLPWGELCDGGEVPVPAELPHPSAAGFRKTSLAAGRGQVADWVRGLPDGSRLHVHEYAAGPGGGAGPLTVHRDQLDPSRGPGSAAVHWFSETEEGHAVGWVLLGGLAAFGLWAVVSEG